MSTPRDAALFRSLLYQVLSAGFRPPDAAGWIADPVGDMANALAGAMDLLETAADADLPAAARRVASAWRSFPAAERPSRHAALFGHTARGAVPPYETEYGEDTLFQQPHEMGDLAAFLRAFGLRISPARHERVDHIACELEFLAFLSRKEAHALETGDADMLSETRRAQRLFLKDHLARFAPAFATRTMKSDPEGPYASLAGLCLAWIASECRRLEVPPGPETLRLREPVDDRAPMACGAAPECAPACGAGGTFQDPADVPE